MPVAELEPYPCRGRHDGDEQQAECLRRGPAPRRRLAYRQEERHEPAEDDAEAAAGAEDRREERNRAGHTLPRELVADDPEGERETAPPTPWIARAAISSAACGRRPPWRCPRPASARRRGARVACR